MLSLPPVPEGYLESRDRYVGVYSVIRLQAEHAGRCFYRKYELARDRMTRKDKSSLEATPSLASSTDKEVSGEDTQRERKKKNFKEHSSISGRVRKAVETNRDLYALLACDSTATPEEIKKMYRKLALIFHPDKGSQASDENKKGPWPDVDKMTPEEINAQFLEIQNAFEILSDVALRRQYDSSLPFDESLPSEKEIAADFFAVCAPAFRKEARWSVRQPVPLLGDMDTPNEEVKRFYKFWADFESRRDFGNAGEFDLDEAQDREERRWMQRENWKVVSKLIKQERARLMRFVSAAEARDPRLLKEKEAERKRKEEAKAARYLAANQHKVAQAAERKRKEEEAMLAQEKAAAEAAQRKKNEKKLVTETRKRIRQPYKTWCTDVNQLCEFTNDDLMEFTVGASIDLLAATADDIQAIIGQVGTTEKPADRKDLSQAVAKCLRKRMSEWNALRYKIPSTSIDRITVEDAPEKTPTTGSTRDWSPEELSILAQGLVKYPGGVADRWSKIAALFNGTVNVDEVIAQAKVLGTSPGGSRLTAQLNAQAFEQSQKRISQEKKIIHTAIDIRDPSTIPSWTAEQQNALEAALMAFPPSLAPAQRWQAIASKVEGKSAKECLARFKEIREAIVAAKKTAR